MTECKAHLDKIMMSPHVSRLVSVHVQHLRSIPSNQHTSGPPHSASALITFTLLTSPFLYLRHVDSTVTVSRPYNIWVSQCTIFQLISELELMNLSYT